MAKLLVADKEMIRNQFAQKARKKLSDYLEGIGTQLQNRVDAILPPEIKSIVDRYPSMKPLLFYSHISTDELLKTTKDARIYEPIPLDGIGMPKMFYGEYLDDFKCFFEKDILEWSKKAYEFRRLENETRNRVACALDYINTEKQLQDNFPEAYKILIEIRGKQKEENKCDSVENTRAFLSSLDK
jgi:hypothetical protein|nr:MAG TPA: Nucleotide modification associated domain 5 [Caudoviricetes sp.]